MANPAEQCSTLLSHIDLFATSGSEEDRNNVEELIQCYLNLHPSLEAQEMRKFLGEGDTIYNPDQIRKIVAAEAFRIIRAPFSQFSSPLSPLRCSYDAPVSPSTSKKPILTLLSHIDFYATSGSEEDRNNVEELIQSYLNLHPSLEAQEMRKFLGEGDTTYNPDQIRKIAAAEAFRIIRAPFSQFSGPFS